MSSPFRHILVATDGSPLADKAVSLAMKLGVDAQVTALLVMPDYGVAGFARATFGSVPDTEALRAQIADEGQRRLADALSRADRHAKTVVRRVAVSDQPWREIIDAAQREGCDLIVMASHGHGGLASAVLGSQTLKVLTLSTLPVLVAR